MITAPHYPGLRLAHRGAHRADHPDAPAVARGDLTPVAIAEDEPEFLEGEVEQ